MFVVNPFSTLMEILLGTLKVYVVWINGFLGTLTLNVVWPSGPIFLIKDLGQL